MTMRDVAFWRECYFAKYGLAVNDLKLTWRPVPTGDTPETDEIIRIASRFGGTIDAETIERYRNIERGWKQE